MRHGFDSRRQRQQSRVDVSKQFKAKSDILSDDPFEVRDAQVRVLQPHDQPQRGNLVERDSRGAHNLWPAKEVALKVVEAEGLRELEFFLGFDFFGEQFDFEFSQNRNLLDKR